MLRRLTLPTLGVLGVLVLGDQLSACTCSGNSALDVIIQLPSEAKSRCVMLFVRSADGTEQPSAPLLTEGHPELQVGVYRGKLSQTVTVVARGYSDEGCQTATVPPEQSEVMSATFAGGQVQRITLRLGAGMVVDADHDGHGAADAGGDDCDDDNLDIFPGAPESCVDQVDNDCDTKIDCQDTQCAGRACGAGRVCRQGQCGEGNCNDGQDNDGDGKTDCDDSDCAGATCSDGNDCTQGEVCQPGGGCDGGLTVVCQPSECQTFTNTCAPGGVCVFAPKSAGTRCTNGVCGDAGTCIQNIYAYAPSNFNPVDLPDASVTVHVDCGEAQLDSTAPGMAPVFKNWCQTATPNWKAVDGGVPEALLVAMDELTIDSSSTLRVYGGRPVILAVTGDALVMGHIEAGARPGEPGPGGTACDAGMGLDGHTGSVTNGGGGGGGYGTPGAMGGKGYGGGGNGGGNGGVAFGSPTLVPLRGGCPGGDGPGIGGDGGLAGGALQLSVARTLTISGRISSAGGGGSGARANSSRSGGGGGGGSGGAVLLEADLLVLTGTGAITANGGGGGAGADPVIDGGNGAYGSVSQAAPAPGGAGGLGGDGGDGGSLVPATRGEDGRQPSSGNGGGGGGGGGGAGRIRLNADAGCVLQDGGVISPAPSNNRAPGCGP